MVPEGGSLDDLALGLADDFDIGALSVGGHNGSVGAGAFAAVDGVGGDGDGAGHGRGGEGDENSLHVGGWCLVFGF